MPARVWATSEDGKIEYVSLTAERLEEAVQLVKKYFFPYENICTAIGLAKSPEGIDEMDYMLKKTAQQGVSLVAIDKETGKIVGVRLSKIQDNTSSQSPYEQYINKVTRPESKGLFKYLVKCGSLVDPFTLYNVDCLLDFVFLVVPPEYGGRGIAFKLCEISLELATQLCKGNNVKTSLNNTELPLEPRPKIVTAIFTTFKTQKIGRKLNFDILKEVSYEDMYDNGKSYASILGPESKTFTIECKKLE